MSKSLVTIATDGFRDYVSLPDGRTLNLGSISVLKLVTSLVGSPKLCRSALNSFLEKGSAVIKVDVELLEGLLRPKRARWAGKDLMFMETGGSAPMTSDQTKMASTEDQAMTKFSTLVLAFNQLYSQPSESTISAFKQASAGFLELTTGKMAGVDESAKHELEEFMENDPKTLKLKENLLEDLLGKAKYDHAQAKRMWLTLVDKSAEHYSSKFDEDDNTLFPRALRESLARDLADKERKILDEGGYDHLKTARDSMKEPTEVSGDAAEVAKQLGVDNPYANVAQDENNNKVGLKLAAEEVSFVNEGLIHLVASKVEAALSAVKASSKQGSEIATSDLHVISTRLDGLTKTANLEDATLRGSLLDLAKKADNVRSFFE